MWYVVSAACPTVCFYGLKAFESQDRTLKEFP